MQITSNSTRQQIVINCRIFILNSNRVQTLRTEQEQQKLTKGEVSYYPHTLLELELQDLCLTRTGITLNALKHTELHCFTH